LNGDSALDLAVANAAGYNVSVLENDGNGRFHNRVDYGVCRWPGSVFCADLDGDGDLDLATANTESNNVTIVKNLARDSVNQPPGPFSLLLPPKAALTPRVVHFDWEDAVDPNPLDQVRYDLYVSLSNHFPLDSTTVESSIIASECSRTLDYGRYFWKVRARDNYGGCTWSRQIRSFTVSGMFASPGDFNGDAVIDVGDVVSAVNYLYRSGPAPEPLESGDANCDDELNIGDVVFLINYLFRGGLPPGC
jgi:hypothetical protein